MLAKHKRDGHLLTLNLCRPLTEMECRVTYTSSGRLSNRILELVPVNLSDVHQHIFAYSDLITTCI